MFYCKAHDENITHKFWTCRHTKQFWKDFTDFCSRNIRETTLTLNDVLYGVEDGTICNLIFTAKILFTTGYMKIKCGLKASLIIYID